MGVRLQTSKYNRNATLRYVMLPLQNRGAVKLHSDSFKALLPYYQSYARLLSLFILFLDDEPGQGMQHFMQHAASKQKLHRISALMQRG